MATKKNQPVDKVQEPVIEDPNAFDPNSNMEQDAAPVGEVAPQDAPVQPPVGDPKPSGKFSEDLKATLKNYPHINNVWVNAKGEWHYGKKAGFVSYSREEILNG